MDTTVKCGSCGRELDERSDIPAQQRQPCPDCGSVARQFETSGSVVVGVSAAMAIEVFRHEVFEAHPVWCVLFVLLTILGALVGGLLVSGWLAVAVSLVSAAILFLVGLRAVTRVRRVEKYSG